MRRAFKFGMVALMVCGTWACGDSADTGPRILNTYGGAARANSYEQFGSFSSTLVMVRELKPASDAMVLDNSGAIAAPLPVTSDQVYLATSGGSVIRSDFKKAAWQASLDGGAVVAAGMAADARGNLYAMANDGAVYSFDAGGRRRWKLAVFEARAYTVFSDVLCLGNQIILASSAGELVACDTAGNLAWRLPLKLAPAKVLAADSDGNILVPLSNNRFGATDSVLYLSPEGQRRWARAFEYTRLIKNPVISGDRFLVAGVRSTAKARVAVLHALDKQGRVTWSRELPMTPRGLSAAKDGSVYVCGYDSGVGQALSTVLALSPEGREQWRMHFELRIPTSVLISESLLAFVGIKEKSTGLYFLRRDGTFTELVSLSDQPVLNLQAAVGTNCDVIFASSEKTALVAVGESAIHKILPY